MHRTSVSRVFLFFVVALATIVITGLVSAQPEIKRPEFVEGELLVKFKANVSDRDIERFNRQTGSKVMRHFEFIDVYHLQLPAGLSVPAAVQNMGRSPLVNYVVPNAHYYIDATFPNDPGFSQLWGLNNVGQTGGTVDADIDAPEAWDITTGSSDVVVAVIDSGMDMTHPDLAANLYTNPGEIPGNGVDDDGNGFVDDVHGWDFRDDDNDPSPSGGACGGHGTHVAGTIGAVGNDNNGISGVNWDVQIMPLRAFYTLFGIFCTTNDAAIIGAIEYHTMMDVPISSNSWGGSQFSQPTEDAIQASKSFFVAAAGNNGTNNDVSPQYPANYDLPNIMSIAATDHNDNLASFSNFGDTVDIAAPGVDIVSTVPGGYDSFDGTSMATPHVAGVAALLLAQDPTLTTNEIKWRICWSFDPAGLPIFTGGRVNAHKALLFGESPMPVTINVEPLGPTTVPAGGSVSYSATLTNNSDKSVTVDAQIYVLTENGVVVTLRGPGSFTLGVGESLSQNFTETVPVGFSGKLDLVGQAKAGSTSFDEDVVAYTVP